jgi:hypothetical protein
MCANGRPFRVTEPAPVPRACADDRQMCANGAARFGVAANAASRRCAAPMPTGKCVRGERRHFACRSNPRRCHRSASMTGKCVRTEQSDSELPPTPPCADAPPRCRPANVCEESAAVSRHRSNPRRCHRPAPMTGKCVRTEQSGSELPPMPPRADAPHRRRPANVCGQSGEVRTNPSRSAPVPPANVCDQSRAGRTDRPAPEGTGLRPACADDSQMRAADDRSRRGRVRVARRRSCEARRDVSATARRLPPCAAAMRSRRVRQVVKTRATSLRRRASPSRWHRPREAR